MPKNTSQENAQIEQPQVTAEGNSPTAAVAEIPAETAENIVQFEARKGGKNGFAEFNAKRSDAVKSKVTLVTDIKKRLAEAAEFAKLGGEQAEKAKEPASQAGILLYRGLTAEAISGEEVTELLGSQFGFKTKKDGSDSKTPSGLGEEIRKRVQRAFKAYDYAVNGNEPVAFFEPLSPEDVVPLLHQVDEGKTSLWGLYGQLGELKASKTGNRPKAAFDPRRIAAMTRDWGTNIAETVAVIQRTPGLFSAMAGMLQMLNTIGNEMPVPETEEEAA